MKCLKTVNPYFEDVWQGRKTFEVRKNDRDFEVGDELNLFEYEPKETVKKFTGRRIEAKVTYMIDDKRFVKNGFVVMGIFVTQRVSEELTP